MNPVTGKHQIIPLPKDYHRKYVKPSARIIGPRVTGRDTIIDEPTSDEQVLSRQSGLQEPLTTKDPATGEPLEDRVLAQAQQDTIGEYIATITARSETLDPFGKPYLLKHEYRFWLIE